MNIAEITDAHRAYWSDLRGEEATFAAPDGMADCEPCRAIITTEPDGSQVVRVPWKPNEIELAQLAQGGTLWLSTWGGLPPHMLEVQP